MSVMSNLNSVLVEGTLEGSPVFFKEDAVSFTILSRCVIENKISGKLEWETARIGIIAADIEEVGGGIKPLAKACMERGKKGRGVRVVGRLAEEETGGLRVIAQHVEFRPELEKNSPKRERTRQSGNNRFI